MSKNAILKDCKILSITPASRILDIAEEKGLNPQEVFVRCTFEYKGNTYTASNKLRILTKKGYEELQNKIKSGETIDLSITDSEFFYIHREISLDELFKDKVEIKDTRHSLAAFFK